MRDIGRHVCIDGDPAAVKPNAQFLCQRRTPCYTDGKKDSIHVQRRLIGKNNALHATLPLDTKQAARINGNSRRKENLRCRAVRQERHACSMREQDLRLMLRVCPCPDDSDMPSAIKERIADRTATDTVTLERADARDGETRTLCSCGQNQGIRRIAALPSDDDIAIAFNSVT